MNMRIKTVLISLTFLVALVSVLFSAVAAAKEPDTTSSPAKMIQSGYILTEFNGKLSVFENGKDTPTAVLDVMVDSLPERDIQKLKSGIFCDTFSKAMELAEDYE